jgi:hypothetical protein
MTIYLVTFMIASLLSFLDFFQQKRTHQIFSIFFAGFLILLVGLRYEVGADWYPYVDIIFPVYKNINFFDIFSFSDPGYGLINYIAQKFNFSIAFVNIVCASIFISGFYKFAKNFHSINGAFLIAIPYMIVVMSMNYTRQTTALGLVLFALSYLINNRIFASFLFIVLASTFHKSAFLFMPFALVYFRDSKFFIYLAILAIPFFAYSIAQLFFEALIDEYLGGDYGSSGSGIRLLINFLAGLTFFAIKSNFYFSRNEETIYNAIAALSIGIFVLSIFIPFTTFFDRIGLYFSIIQIIAFSNLMYLLRPRPVGFLILMPIYFFTLYFWLSNSAYAQSWIPYSFSL